MSNCDIHCDQSSAVAPESGHTLQLIPSMSNASHEVKRQRCHWLVGAAGVKKLHLKSRRYMRHEAFVLIEEHK